MSDAALTMSLLNGEQVLPAWSARSAEAAGVMVVIPHCGGMQILDACLRSLAQSRHPMRVLLVDNASPDESVQMLQRRFPWVELAEQKHNLGFAGGCNAGLRLALQERDCRWALLLNNDTTVEADWLDELLKVGESREDIAAVQPLLLSIPNPGMLDYSGAAGGQLDVCAFPFALGRIADRIEEDSGFYHEPRALAWASGTACLLRCDALRESGLLEESFFMHMEEIDLDWRLRLLGWHLLSAPAARVYHHSGYSLGAGRPLKVFLNHRNSLRMLVRNAACVTLWRRLPQRLLLDLLAIVHYTLKGRPDHSLAALKGLGSFLVGLPATLRERRQIQQGRRVAEAEIQGQHYPGSIALAAFVHGAKTCSDLNWQPPLAGELPHFRRGNER